MSKFSYEKFRYQDKLDVIKFDLSKLTHFLHSTNEDKLHTADECYSDPREQSKKF